MTFLVDVDGFNGVESEGGVVGGQKDVHSDLEVILVSLTTLQQLLYSLAHTPSSCSLLETLALKCGFTFLESQG